MWLYEHLISETDRDKGLKPSPAQPISADCMIGELSFQPCLLFLAKDTKYFNPQFDGSRSLV